jgi:2-polyprenyl-3-methyl-5-hydroxy-6-metoxy-1,4-benzoquinol methylase
VTGVDYSRRSIAFARDFARQQGLAIDYRCQESRPPTALF